MPPDYVSPYAPFLVLFVKILFISTVIAIVSMFGILVEIPFFREWWTVPSFFMFIAISMCCVALSLASRKEADDLAHQPQLLTNQVHTFTISNMTTGVEVYAELQSIDKQYKIPFMYLGRTCEPLSRSTQYNFVLTRKKYWNGAIVASYNPEYVRRTVCGR